MQTRLQIASVETRTDAKGEKYAYAKATMLKKDGSLSVDSDGNARTYTVMAFGKAFENTRRYLRKGKVAEVTARFDKGIVRIMGRRAAQPATAAA